jgi:hypothetical protein
VSLAYFGQKGTRLYGRSILTSPVSPRGSLDERRPYVSFKNSSGSKQLRHPLHTSEVRAERRFRSGVAFVAAYRFSRSIDAHPDQHSRGSHNLRLSASFRFSMKHRLVFSTVYNLPQWPFINGWQVQAIGTVQSGMPLSAILGADVAKPESDCESS